MADNDPMINGKPLSSLRVVDLKQELERRGLSKSGTKKDLADRLRNACYQESNAIIKEPEDPVDNSFNNVEMTGEEESHAVIKEPNDAADSSSHNLEDKEDEAADTTIKEPLDPVDNSLQPVEKNTDEASDAITREPQDQVESSIETLEKGGGDNEADSIITEPQHPPEVSSQNVEQKEDEAVDAVIKEPQDPEANSSLNVENRKEEEADAIANEPQDPVDDSSENCEKKMEEDAGKNDVSSTGKADDSASDNSVSKTRPKRKWASSRTERPQRQGISTSELNNLLPSKEKVSRMASQDETAAGEVGSDESASIASSVAKASSETTAANTTFSGKSSASLADDGDDSSLVVPKTDVKSVSDSEKHSLSDSTTAASASKVSKGQTSPPPESTEEPAEKVQTPPRNAVSRYLFICNLTRPFTVKALQNLLSKFGSIKEDHWIDKIKSKCIFEFDSEEHSQEARKELHGLRWPDSNPKTLVVDFSSFDEFNQYKLAEQENTSSASAKPASQEVTERVEPKPRSVDKYDVVLRSTNEEPNENEASKRHVREWDRDKVTDVVSPKRSRRSPHEKDRGTLTNRFVRIFFASIDLSHNLFTLLLLLLPVVEEKRVEKEAPRLLDDLFKKTRALPVLYWLPLTEEEAEKRTIVREEKMKKRKQEIEAREERMREMRERRNQSPRGRKVSPSSILPPRSHMLT